MIYIVIPTTPERRARVAQLVDSIWNHTNDVEHSIVIFENELGGWVPAVHKALEGLSPESLVVLLGSDVVVEAGWLKELSTALYTAYPDGDGVAEPFNELHGANLCQHPMAKVKTIIKYLDKGFTHWYSDNWFTELAKRDGKLVYVPKARIEHRHFVNKKADIDETYRKIFDPVTVEKDRLYYEGLKKTI